MGAGFTIARHKFCVSAVLTQIERGLAGMRHLIFALQRFYMKINKCRLATKVCKRNSEETGVRLEVIKQGCIGKTGVRGGYAESSRR